MQVSLVVIIMKVEESLTHFKVGIFFFAQILDHLMVAEEVFLILKQKEKKMIVKFLVISHLMITHLIQFYQALVEA